MSILPQRILEDKADLVIFDSNHLAHRALWTTGDLSHNGLPTGTLYGFVNQVQSIRSLFSKSSILVFAWDSKNSLRKELYKEYKSQRKNASTPEEITRKEAFYYQMEIIRQEVMEPLGYMNHFKEEGFEADDIIASLCLWAKNHPRKINATWIVSSDHDLYQLLENATMFQPHTKRNYNKETLKKEWGVSPHQWSQVLAIAGCAGDGVPGVMGVGLSTASRYVLGEKIRPTQMVAIQRARRMIERNIKLVSLPFENRNLVPDNFNPQIHKDNPSGKRRVKEQFGFNI